eukprot:UN18558
MSFFFSPEFFAPRILKSYLGRRNTDFSSRSPTPFFLEPRKIFPAIGNLDFFPTNIFSLAKT